MIKELWNKHGCQHSAKLVAGAALFVFSRW